MGGIAGIQYLKNSLKVDEQELLVRMLNTMQHRAPYHNVKLFDQVGGFGVRYHQLETQSGVIAHNSSKNLMVIIDGEIFRLLNGNDSNRSGILDAEVILELYQKDGEEFLDKIDGSYAIAIWDGREKKLLLARDRLGYKPLFFFQQGKKIVFASEIKAILESGLYKKAVDLLAMNNFLSYGYVANPETLFEGIRQVRPGHQLLYKNGEMTERPYWKFQYNQDAPGKPEEYYLEKFHEIFKASVARRFKRYPDCGAFLSGGLDTSCVVAAMHELKQESFKVFAGGFKEEQYNEVGDAKVVSDHLGLDLLTVIIEFKEDFPQFLEKMVWHHDGPFADTSAIPSYFAAKLAKEHVDVVLTGDFPDQLIGGSGHHAEALSREKNDPPWKKMMRNETLNKWITGIPWAAGGTGFFDKFKRFLHRETFSLEDQRVVLNMPIPPLLKRNIYSEDLIAIDKRFDPMNIARGLYKKVEDASLLDKILYFDSLSYAPDDLMVKVERMTMANGLVAVSPFHDRELVEFIATVPTDLKIRGESRKYIQREAFRPFLPEHTLNKKKKGFDMPIGEWMVRKMSDFVRDVLLDSRTLNRGYFNKAFFRSMVEDFLKMKTDYASGSEGAIISLITLELWHRIFIDN